MFKEGVNNFIGNNVRIHENIVIGNNNKYSIEQPYIPILL